MSVYVSWQELKKIRQMLNMEPTVMSKTATVLYPYSAYILEKKNPNTIIKYYVELQIYRDQKETTFK